MKERTSKMSRLIPTLPLKQNLLSKGNLFLAEEGENEFDNVIDVIHRCDVLHDCVILHTANFSNPTTKPVSEFSTICRSHGGILKLITDSVADRRIIFLFRERELERELQIVVMVICIRAAIAYIGIAFPRPHVRSLK